MGVGPTMVVVAGSLMVILLLGSAAQVHSDCADNNVKAALRPCEEAVTGDHPPLPSAECCDNIKHLSVGCLCTALSLDILKGINREAAFNLPQNCKVTFPPGSKCEDATEYPIPAEIFETEDAPETPPGGGEIGVEL